MLPRVYLDTRGFFGSLPGSSKAVLGSLVAFPAASPTGFLASPQSSIATSFLLVAHQTDQPSPRPICPRAPYDRFLALGGTSPRLHQQRLRQERQVKWPRRMRSSKWQTWTHGDKDCSRRTEQLEKGTLKRTQIRVSGSGCLAAACAAD